MKPTKALTVCQGWASLMFQLPHPKNVENRVWWTSYRGDLLIHAGKSKKQIAEAREFCDFIGVDFPQELVLGAIIGVVELIRCDRNSESIWAATDQCHWQFTNPRLFAEPIACNGALSLWTPSDEVLEKIAATELVPLCIPQGGKKE